MERADVRDLRATSIPKHQQKERRVTGELKKEELPPDAKRARYLQKLLRQIEALQERKDNGEKLDAAQLQKLARMDEVVAELEELFGVDLGSSDEEEEGDYEGQQEEGGSENDGNSDFGSDDDDAEAKGEVKQGKKKKKSKKE